MTELEHMRQAVELVAMAREELDDLSYTPEYLLYTIADVQGKLSQALAHVARAVAKPL